MVGHAHSTTIDLGCAIAHLLAALFDITNFVPFPNVAEFQSQSKLYYEDLTYFQLNVAKMCYIDGHPDLVDSLGKD